MTAPSGEDGVQTVLANHLDERHRKMLIEESAIDPAVVAERGYRTVTTKKELQQKGFSAPQRDTLAPREAKYGLLAPICWPHVPEPPFWVLRPDRPRVNKRGKKVKYEMPPGTQMAPDSPPRCHPMLGDPSVPLFLTEGQKKGDSGASRGGCWVDLIGVWNWRGTNEHGGKTTLAELEDVAFNGRKVYLVYDSDILEKLPVYNALVRIREVAKKRGADVWIIHLPSGSNGEKVGVDDWFAADPSRTLHDLIQLASKELIEPVPARHVPPEGQLLAETMPEDARSPDGLLVPLGYEVGSGGVVKVDVVGEGESMRERRISVAPRPLYIAGIVEAVGGGEHRLLLVGRYRERWMRVLAARADVMDARKLTALAGAGLPVSSGRAGLVSEYLDAFEAQNLDLLPVAKVSAQMAWAPSDEYLRGKGSIEKEEE